MKKIIFLGLVLSLIGCSTSPVVSNTAKPIPNERVYNQNYLKKHTPEQAKVTFLRDKGFWVLAVLMIFMLIMKRYFQFAQMK